MVTFANVIVIYFALGVPFAVLSASPFRERFDPRDVMSIFYHLAFWPLTALEAVLNKPDSSRRTGLTVNDVHMLTGEKGVISGDPVIRRRIRLQIATLHGLTKARTEAIAAKQIRAPFYGVISHPAANVAARCFQRRNIARLERHIRAAQNELSKVSHDSSTDRFGSVKKVINFDHLESTFNLADCGKG